ncbi:hypothetical protein [Leptospira mayottensis]|uniref:Lipoprotein n=3 Tax=Leptospira TaxID=171 RepID=A0AA87MMF2_9LEPT|nr:hypothetical protein [Leptospira mayottensis]AZQ01303.1 hypothetical protein LEP1GSC190_03770 [Leptospira mayottensis 200901116]EMO60190.1 putative lipoprotein [Leptospira borgpetersenii serovar Pomona str. 200901868]AXR59384.1 hypothetical protein DQM68_00230 [Leptospira mayottensis]AXR63166.1 hypothetical protein DQM28_01865 [Leptospira mayottensis]EKR98347.1 putative lipoprotein [Leptospira mayottensis 200901122]
MRKIIICVLVLFLFACRDRIMFSTDQSILYRFIGNGTVKELGKIYPGFPLMVKSDWLPTSYEIVDRFLDIETYGERYFTFARGLTKNETKVHSYGLFYNRGEKTLFNNVPYMWILVYADKAALIRTGFISEKKRGRSFIGAKYWICKPSLPDEGEIRFTNCERGEKRTSLDTSFVPMLKEVQVSEDVDTVCTSITEDKITCNSEGSNYIGIKSDKFYIR